MSRESLCGADPIATARSLRRQPEKRPAALDCYEFGASRQDDPALHYEAAALAFELGQSGRLMKALRESVRLAPDFGDGHFELANALMSQGHAREAIAAYRQALTLGETLSDRPMCMNNLGNALTDLGDNAGALAIFKKGLQLAPTFVYLHHGLANVLSSLERPEEAAATLEKGLSYKPDADYLQYNYGSALRKLKRPKEAEVAFEAALSIKPNEWRYLQGMGQLLHEGRRLEGAIDHYERAQASLRTNREPRSGPLERDYSAALREAKRYEEAEAAAKGAIELQPHLPDSYTALSNVYQEAGRHEERALILQLEAEADVTHRASIASEAERTRAYSALRRSREAARLVGRRRLVLFCRRSYSGEKSEKPGSWEWGPKAKERGIGGSESAVISLSRELVQLGWSVEVYASPPFEDYGLDDGGVTWLPHWAYRTAPPPPQQSAGGGGSGSGSGGGGGAIVEKEGEDGGPDDVFISWRFAEALYLARAPSQSVRRYLWLHDEVMEGTVPKAALPLLTPGTNGLQDGGIFVLSQFHKSQLPPHAASHAIITSNGLDAAAIADGPNHNNHFLYASTPSAGLHLLLTMWREIRESLPNARLDVYYGFWP